VTADELKEFVPAALEQLYPGQWEVFLPGHIWKMDRGDVPSLLSVHTGDGNPDYIRVHSGAAIHVPFGVEVALAVASFNKQLWNGRAYLQVNQERSLCLVALEENFFAEALSYDFMPSLDDFARRLGTMTLWAGKLGEQLRTEHGGAAIAGSEVGVLI
jgi:hypothetical protein